MIKNYQKHKKKEKKSKNNVAGNNNKYKSDKNFYRKLERPRKNKI